LLKPWHLSRFIDLKKDENVLPSCHYCRGHSFQTLVLSCNIVFGASIFLYYILPLRLFIVHPVRKNAFFPL